MRVLFLSNFWFLCLSPPTTMAEPSTMSEFDSTEPSRLRWISRTCASFSATMDRMSSVAFPKVTFRSAPSVSFVRNASCSVTNA